MHARVVEYYVGVGYSLADAEGNATKIIEFFDKREGADFMSYNPYTEEYAPVIGIFDFFYFLYEVLGIEEGECDQNEHTQVVIIFMFIRELVR